MYTSVWVQKLLGKELKNLLNSYSLQVSQEDLNICKMCYLGYKSGRICSEYIKKKKKKTTFILALFAVQKMDSKWSTLLHYFTNELVYQQSSSKYSKVHGQSEGCLIELILL